MSFQARSIAIGVLLTTGLLFSPLTSSAAKVIGSSNAARVIGNPDAPVGGTFYRNLGAEPPTLNPLRSSDVYATMVQDHVFDSLLTRNLETFEFESALAEKWEVTKDGKSITFTLREGAHFHDGSPVTVDDVKFSFDVRFDPKLADATYISYYENIEKAEILSPRQVKFHIKKKYFNNLAILGGMEILPKTHYGDAKKKMNKKIIGSGPYIFEKYDQGKAILLKRNPSWWGHALPSNKGIVKFDRIHFKIITDKNAQLETFKKGGLDYLDLEPDQFEKKTDGDIWGQKVFKKAVEHSGPKKTSFIGLNLKRPMFADKDVRRALSELFNREMMIKKFFYGKYTPASGPWYPQNPYADPKAKPLKYDPVNARKLLAKAGWADKNKDGILEKTVDGKSMDFKFEVMTATNVWEKYLTVYKEELKKAGINLQIKVVEWNAFQKILDDRSFDAVAMAWGGVIETDPKQIWHSESARKGGSNFISYSNPNVDKLIDQAREELDAAKRKSMLAKVYSAVAGDYPYLFLWSPKDEFYGHSARVGMAQPTYKYGVGQGAWWIQQQ